MFCDACGQQFMPHESVCTRCRVAPTRHLLQLLGLVILSVAIAWNSLLALFFLPRLAADHHSRIFRMWLHFSEKVSAFGWTAVALGLLGWSFWARRGYQLHLREWLARVLLILLLFAGILAAPIRWMPEGLASPVRTPLHQFPGMGPVAAWGMIILVAGILSANSETRDALLGHGRALSLVSLASLLFELALTTLSLAAVHL